MLVFLHLIDIFTQLLQELLETMYWKPLDDCIMKVLDWVYLEGVRRKSENW